MYSILRNCIDYHTKTLKRRDIAIKTLPKEFEITELKKEVKDLRQDVSKGKGAISVLVFLGTIILSCIGFFQFK